MAARGTGGVVGIASIGSRSATAGSFFHPVTMVGTGQTLQTSVAVPAAPTTLQLWPRGSGAQ